MVNRWIGILSAACALLATSEVVRRDMLLEWLADQAPVDALFLAPGEERLGQVGIFDGELRELGRSWTRSARQDQGDLITIGTTTVLGPVGLRSGLSIPRIRVETVLEYRGGSRRIDQLDFQVHGLGMPIELKGEAMPSGEFPCKWQIGEQSGQFMLDSKAPAALGDALRPFDRLPNLFVGQTWRLDLLNPLAQLMPQAGDGMEFEQVRIEVTGTEKYTHQGRELEAFIVEGGGVKAWVDNDGRVLRQEIENVPLLGKLIVLDEPYSADERKAGAGSVARESP